MFAARALATYSVFVFCFAALLGLAQTGGQTGGNTGGGTTATKSAPPTTSRPQQRQPQQDQRPIFLRGTVIVDDGTQPSERVAIERVCNGRVRREAYTDMHGAFSFQLGGATPPMFQDASEGGFDPTRTSIVGPNSGTANIASGPPGFGVSTRDLMSCELRASMPGFRSDTIPLAGLQLYDNVDVGNIVLHRMGKVEGTRISLTTMRAPKDAKKAFERGTHLLKQHKEGEAGKEFAKAIAVYPQFAEAIAKLGEVYMDEGRMDDAEKLFQQAIEADSRFMPPYLDLTLLAARKQDWKHMAELSDRMLALNAYEYPAVYYFSAVANYNLHKLDVAEKNARTARRLDSQYHIPKIDFLLADVLFQRGDYTGAADELRSFLKHEPTGPNADSARILLGRTEQIIAAAPAAEPK